MRVEKRKKKWERVTVTWYSAYWMNQVMPDGTMIGPRSVIVQESRRAQPVRHDLEPNIFPFSLPIHLKSTKRAEQTNLIPTYFALLTGMGLTLWLRKGDTTSKNCGSLGGSGGVSAGSTGCFFFFCRISFHRGIWTGGGGGTKGQSLTVVNKTGCGWLCDKPDCRSFSDASALREDNKIFC